MNNDVLDHLEQLMESSSDSQSTYSMYEIEKLIDSKVEQKVSELVKHRELEILNKFLHILRLITVKQYKKRSLYALSNNKSGSLWATWCDVFDSYLQDVHKELEENIAKDLSELKSEYKEIQKEAEIINKAVENLK